MEWERFGDKALDFITTPIQEDARITILDGAVRSGKTIAMIPKWIDYIHNGPKGRLLQAGVSKQTIKTNVLNDLFDTVGSSNYRYNKQSGELRIYDRDILVVGLKDEGSEKYLRGATFAGCHHDEATMAPESAFKQILNRMSVEGSKYYATTNPDSPYHYLYTDYITNKEKLASGMVKRIHFALDDNPSLSEEYKTFIRAAYSGLWYRRMILGQWVMADGAIYDMYDNKKHVITADMLPKRFKRTLIGVDYGAGNPTVFLKIGITFRHDGKPIFWIYDEYYHNPRATNSKTAVQYKADFITFTGGDRVDTIYIDPSALGFINELKSNSCGVSFGNIGRANNAVLPGINSVATAMSDNRFAIVGGNCPNTVKEEVSYIWDVNAQKRGEDKPMKENDHCMDAKRYPIHTEFPAASFQRVYI